MRWRPRRVVPKVAFEFVAREHTPLAAWIALTIALAFGADTFWQYHRVRKEVRETALRLAQPKPQESVKASAYQPRDVDREVAFARSVIARISAPWNELFQALDAVSAEGVQLTVVEPELESRSLRLVGEARDVPAMLTYVARVDASAYFSDVTLRQQERRKDGKGISFVVTAGWRQKG